MVLSPTRRPQAVPCLRWPRAGGWGWRLAHSLLPSLAPTKGGKIGGWPPSQGLGERSTLPRLLCPWLGFLFGVIAVRVSTLRSGSQLVFGLVLWGIFFVFGFGLFFTSGSFGAAGFCCDYFWFLFVGWFLSFSFFPSFFLLFCFVFLVSWGFFVFCFLLVFPPLSLQLQGPSAPPPLTSSPSSQAGGLRWGSEE